MKNFIYKSLVVFFLFVIAFHLTFNLKLRQYEKQLKSLTDKQNIQKVKTKIKDEMNNAIEKENYLTIEEINLINNFIKKIKEELNQTQ